MLLGMPTPKLSPRPVAASLEELPVELHCRAPGSPLLCA